MDKKMLNVRSACIADLPAIAKIYEHHVLHGSASFESLPPGEQEFRSRYENIIGAGYPYLVAELDGVVQGYAYASAYRARYAYRFAVEDSIYVRDGLAGKGIGRALLSELITRCEVSGFRLMIAVIGDSANAGSIAVHARAGFRFAGVLPAVGYKHDRWVDSVLMTRALGEGDHSAPMPLTVGAHQA
jgi:L-amino acid N-acyltransferase YncA